MALDNQTIFNYSLGVGALLLWFVMFRFFGFLMELQVVQIYLQPSETMMTLIPFLLGLGTAGGALAAVKRYEPAERFGVEVTAEMRKVVWPTRKELNRTTLAVLIVVFVIAVILFIFDKIFGFLINLLVR